MLRVPCTSLILHNYREQMLLQLLEHRHFMQDWIRHKLNPHLAVAFIYFFQLLHFPSLRYSPKELWEVLHWMWVIPGWRLQTEAGAGQCWLAVLSSQASPMLSQKRSAYFSKSWSGSLVLDTATLHGSPPYCWPCSMAQVGCYPLYSVFTFFLTLCTWKHYVPMQFFNLKNTAIEAFWNSLLPHFILNICFDWALNTGDRHRTKLHSLQPWIKHNSNPGSVSRTERGETHTMLRCHVFS